MATRCECDSRRRRADHARSDASAGPRDRRYRRRCQDRRDPLPMLERCPNWTFFEIDRKIRISCQKADELLRQERGQCGGVGQQPDAAFQTRRIGAQFAAHLLDLAKDRAGMPDERNARRRRAHATTVTLQQWRASAFSMPAMRSLTEASARCIARAPSVRLPRSTTAGKAAYRSDRNACVVAPVARIAILRFCRSPAWECQIAGSAASSLALLPCHPFFSFCAGILAGAMNAWQEAVRSSACPR